VDIPLKALDMPPIVQIKKDGRPSVAFLKYLDRNGYILRETTGVFGQWSATPVSSGGATYSLPLTSPLTTEEKLKPGQTARIKEYLLEEGWEPTMWNVKRDKETGATVKTSPLLADKVTKEICPNLRRMGKERVWVEILIEWMQTRTKMSLLKGASGATGLLVKSDSVPGGGFVMRSDADTCGTPTARFKHRGIVNIPRVTSFMGKEFRSLFRAREGKVMVGWDADSLEACMEAHYVYPFDPDYALTLTEGDSALGTDVHTLNWKKLGLKDRDVAKTFKYAITYGARPPKLAESLNVSLTKATLWYDHFWELNHGLTSLKDSLEAEWHDLEQKYLIGLDGRLLTTRKKSALLNTKLQGAGAVVMKHAMIIADARIKKSVGDMAHGLIRMHDEEQWECLPDIAEEVGRIGCESIRDAGVYLKLNVPLSGSYKIGADWSETH
jgi:hypothetical protein